MSEEAEDLRHDGAYAPPLALERNPFKPATQQAREYLRALLSRGRIVGDLAESVKVLLDNEVGAASIDLTDLRPKPEFLAYADPAGRFECNPSASAFTGEHLSVLELRVLAAHLATGLDNVNAELKKRM